MNIAFSNIGWPKKLDQTVANLLAAKNITKLEIAPTRSFSNLENVSPAGLKQEKLFWQESNISIVAMQSLLYGMPELQLFGTLDSRRALFDHLSRLYKIATELGANKLVFGSPKNRIIPHGMQLSEAWKIATDFFKNAGDAANDFGIQLCLEPNPSIYGCNFITTAEEGINLVREVASDGFKLHLDTSCMALSGDDAEQSIINAGQDLAHFHVSAPGLGPLEEYFVDHAASSRALEKIVYKGTISVEMRPNLDPESTNSISGAMSLIDKYYISK